MHTPLTPRQHEAKTTADASSLSGFATLRDLLDLLAMLRDPNEPLSSPEGLRRAIDTLLKLGESLGVDSELLAKLRTLVDNPLLFDLLLAVARYTFGLFDFPLAPRSASGVRPFLPQGVDLEMQAIDLTTWLAIITEVISLLQRLRQSRT